MINRHAITSSMQNNFGQLLGTGKIYSRIQIASLIDEMIAPDAWYEGEASSQFKGPVWASYPQRHIDRIWNDLPGDTNSDRRRVNHPYLDYEWVTKTQLFERICAIFGLLPIGPSEKAPSPEADRPDPQVKTTTFRSLDEMIAGLVDALWPSIANVTWPGTGELRHTGTFYHHTGCHAGTKDNLRYIIEAHLGLNPQGPAAPTLERIAYGNRRRS